MSFLTSAISGIGGIVRAGIQNFVPGGGALITAYDAYNSATGRQGAFSPPPPTDTRGNVPSALPTIASSPGVSLVTQKPNLPAIALPPGGAGGGVVKIIPSQQGVAGTFDPGITAAGVRPRGHWTKGTKSNPRHWSNKRRPHMNPMNVRAARRAVRRITSAEKLFRKILHISHPGHAAGRITPKRRKR